MQDKKARRPLVIHALIKGGFHTYLHSLEYFGVIAVTGRRLPHQLVLIGCVIATLLTLIAYAVWKELKKMHFFWVNRRIMFIFAP